MTYKNGELSSPSVRCQPSPRLEQRPRSGMPMDLAVRCSNGSGCVGHHTPDFQEGLK